MRLKRLLTSMVIGLGFWAGTARAAVNIQVDLTTQTMHVTSGSGETRDWPVSTARAGFATPRGRYGVQSLQAMHYSRKYHNSPMPHSIFFKGGYAIHGTFETASLGAAASHGCVRLSPDHAAELYGMVRAEGARISITGQSRDTVVARRHADTRMARADDPDRRATARQRRAERAYARRLQVEESPLAYAPYRPSSDDWMQDPFRSLTDY